MLINAGVKRVVCQRKYHAAKLTREFLKKAKIPVVYAENKVEMYPNQ